MKEIPGIQKTRPKFHTQENPQKTRCNFVTELTVKTENSELRTLKRQI